LVIRSSSSLPKAISALPDKPLLAKNELIEADGIGLFVVGSHVKKTTLQLQNLLAETAVCVIEIDVQSVLDKQEHEFQRAIAAIKTAIDHRCTPVVFTSRAEIRLDDKAERLRLGQTVSDFLVQLVHELPFQPSYLVAKGGITSNDILTKGLGVDSAQVMGQIITGVPAINTGINHRYPNLPYIIFPGNVGDEMALVHVFKTLTMK
jgi:uncharacterized protein YgbK (DUF1537 family)